MSRASRQKGKRVERQIAKMLGTTRNKSDGLSHTDIYMPGYKIELKARKSLPDWIHSAMQQAIDDPTDGVPIVILVESTIGQKPVRYALMRFDDFKFLTMGPDDEATMQ